MKLTKLFYFAGHIVARAVTNYLGNEPVHAKLGLADEVVSLVAALQVAFWNSDTTNNATAILLHTLTCTRQRWAVVVPRAYCAANQVERCMAVGGDALLQPFIKAANTQGNVKQTLLSCRVAGRNVS